MRSVRLASYLVWGFALAASLSYGADPYVMSEAGVRELNDSARKLYQKGIKRLDRVNYEAALDCFLQAQDAAPEAVQIRFLTARLAAAEASKRAASEAIQLFEKARASYQSVLDLKEKGAQVRRPDARRAQDGLTSMSASIANQDTKDQERARIGKDILDQYTMEIEAVRKSKDDKTKGSEQETKKKQQAPPAAGAGSGAGARRGR